MNKAKEKACLAMSCIVGLSVEKKEELIRVLLECAIRDEIISVWDADSINELASEMEADGKPVDRASLELPYWTSCGEPII